MASSHRALVPSRAQLYANVTAWTGLSAAPSCGPYQRLLQHAADLPVYCRRLANCVSHTAGCAICNKMRCTLEQSAHTSERHTCSAPARLGRLAGAPRCLRASPRRPLSCRPQAGLASNPGAGEHPPWIWTRQILSELGPRTGGSPPALLGARGCGALLDALGPGGLAPGRVADLLRRVVRGRDGLLGRGRGAGHGGGRRRGGGWGAGARGQWAGAVLLPCAWVTRKSRFWRFLTNGRGGARREISGPKARNFYGSLCLNDCLTTIPMIYCEVCLCPTSHLWSNHHFQALCKCSL